MRCTPIAIGLSLGLIASVSTVGVVAAETPVGNGHCKGGEFCQFKSDTNGQSTKPVADWSGDVDIPAYSPYWYYNTTDSPNDDVEWIWNRDPTAQRLFEDPSQSGPSSCFSRDHNSTDTKGRENNGSSHERLSREMC